MIERKIKACFCDDKKHDLEYHGIAKRYGEYYKADFPFNNPPTKDTGFWVRRDFHLVGNWGK